MNHTFALFLREGDPEITYVFKLHLLSFLYLDRFRNNHDYEKPLWTYQNWITFRFSFCVWYVIAWSQGARSSSHPCSISLPASLRSACLRGWSVSLGSRRFLACLRPWRWGGHAWSGTWGLVGDGGDMRVTAGSGSGYHREHNLTRVTEMLVESVQILFLRSILDSLGFLQSQQSMSMSIRTVRMTAITMMPAGPIHPFPPDFGLVTLRSCSCLAPSSPPWSPSLCTRKTQQKTC